MSKINSTYTSFKDEINYSSPICIASNTKTENKIDVRQMYNYFPRVWMIKRGSIILNFKKQLFDIDQPQFFKLWNCVEYSVVWYLLRCILYSVIHSVHQYKKWFLRVTIKFRYPISINFFVHSFTNLWQHIFIILICATVMIYSWVEM